MGIDLLAAKAHAPFSSKAPRAWHGELSGVLEIKAGRTVMAQMRHCGPLRIQKLLYPETPARADVLLLHPPSGIASGDQLKMDFHLRTGSAGRFTTPGAGKWYRCAGPHAQQEVRLRIDTDAALEWLPQEAIVFNGAKAHADIHIECAEGARVFGWDIWMLGRQRSGERFDQGHLKLRGQLRRNGQLLWSDRAVVHAGDGIVSAPQGWNDCTIFGSAWIIGLPNDDSLLDRLRAVRQSGVQLGVTRFEHGLWLVRGLGHSAEALRCGFTRIWQIIRPALFGADGHPPRIWAT